MSADDPPAPKEYIIDGNTAVDDLLFAKLYADMDKKVIGLLDETDPAPRLQADAFTEALRKANLMLDQSRPLEGCEEGLEALSTSSSSSASEDDGEIEERAVGVVSSSALARGLRCEDFDLLEDGEMAEECVEEFKADKLLEMPAGMLPKIIPDCVDDDDVLILMGSIVVEVEDMLTVKAAGLSSSGVSPGAGGVWELGSFCCLANRKVIGYVIDTMGPTHGPLYVVKKTSAHPLEAGLDIYTTQNSAIAALVTV